ncbi:MAG: MFS transporter [Candidatus Sumerlaeota bacterium]|nr:MFS transporter [Candidatus Sumerlaeota bacterium]
MSSNSNSHAEMLAGINPPRLFLGSCLALIATAVSFAVIADIMGPLKSKFVLTNLQVGEIAGAATWGFTVSIFVLGPLCNILTMRGLLWFAFLCHIAGPALMMFASGSAAFWELFFGALIIALGNGTVEAVCNPLTATVYPKEKTKMLNRFHMWFPGGIVIGGVACFALAKFGMESYQARLALIVAPAIVYGILFLGQKFPATERSASGVSFGQMFAFTFSRPLFIILFLCMTLTASLELGPGRWIPSILQAGGIAGILVLCYINGLMAVLRFFAGPVVHKLSNPGVLVISAILAGLGLWGLSYAESTVMAFAMATVFALGVCYFWPTMLGTVSERIPKGGELALALMGGMGMLAVGVVTSPQMGKIADTHLYDKLKPAETTAALQAVTTEFVSLKAAAKGKQGDDIQAAIDSAQKTLDEFKKSGGKELPKETANSLRAAIGVGGKSKSAEACADVLNPADNFGGRMSFRYVAPLSLILIVVFSIIAIMDKAKGGSKQEHISG